MRSDAEDRPPTASRQPPVIAPYAGEGRIRNLPRWTRVGSVGVRAAHVVCFAVVAGSAVVGSVSPAVAVGWGLALLTGLFLLGYEWTTHPDHWRQVSGWVFLLKLSLVAAAAAWPAAAVVLLPLAVIAGVFGAHLPRRLRHHLLFGPR